MRTAILGLVLMVAGAMPVNGQGTPAEARPVLRLHLDPLYQVGYEPARELRLALWDSPMSRLELAAAREQWAFRNPGPTGPVLPFESGQFPMRLRLQSPAQTLLPGPWNPSWSSLTWQEKVAGGAQTGLVTLALIQLLGHIH
jgi:hypothetical protein